MYNLVIDLILCFKMLRFWHNELGTYSVIKITIILCVKTTLHIRKKKKMFFKISILCLDEDKKFFGSKLWALSTSNILRLWYTQGWNKNLLRKTNTNKRELKLTRAGYFKYRLGIRDGLFNTFIYGGKLVQQWIVDSYVKIGRDRIEYWRIKQSI